MMVNTLSILVTIRSWTVRVAEIKKETMSSSMEDTMEPIKNGRFFILMKKMRNQQPDLMRIAACLEIDHST